MQSRARQRADQRRDDGAGDGVPGPAAADAYAWAEPASTVIATLSVDPEEGLSSAEAERRRARYGSNELRRTRTVSQLQIFVNQLESIVVALLVAAAVLSFAIGDYLEGSAIGAALLLTVAMGYFTELRAVRSMEALRRLGAVRVRSRRDCDDLMLPAQELVPGDIVLVEGGDRITADMRLLEASKLQADESTLTGESVPVGKITDALHADTPLADRKNMLYKGTTTTRGSGLAVVTNTGMRSELGRIAALVEEAADEETPLEKHLATLARRLVWVCLAIAAVTAAAGIASGRDTVLMLETAIALAVAAIPEGLPVVATIALARGMWRLATRHALIKNLSAVETLGATGVIVTDKTGTLTENRLSVVTIYAGDRAHDLGLTRNAEAPSNAHSDAVDRALELGALCNNASITETGETGDPLEVALLRAAADAAMNREDLLDRYPEVREDAFDSDVKMMATVHAVDGQFRFAVKGAPEVVLAVCDSIWTDEGIQPLTCERSQMLTSRGEDMARTGLRVLAIAEKTTESGDDPAYAKLTLVGLVGLADPPRKEVVAPLAACRRAGIRVVMATGDQPETAATIARAVGLFESGDGEVVHGANLADMDSLNEEQQRALLAANVFARVTPEQKLDIIALHQRHGSVVAMTGDGVNDAPALRKADIGIAMGQRGTDVARDASAMVLKDDSFESIVVAVEQGRAIFENIRRFVVYLLSCNVSEVFVVTVAVALALPLPLLPLQILFLNLVTDVFPALALGFGAGDPRAMERPPRAASEPIVASKHWVGIAAYGALLSATVLGAMATVGAMGANPAQSTSVGFMTLALSQLWHVFNMRGPGTRMVRNDVVGNPWVWGAIVLCLALLAAAAFFGPLATVLDVVPLSPSLWAVVVGTSLAPLVVGQIVLFLRRG